MVLLMRYVRETGIAKCNAFVERKRAVVIKRNPRGERSYIRTSRKRR